MTCRIVPTALSEAIYRRVDEAIAASDNPDNAALDREEFYRNILDFFDSYGYLPEFELVKKEVPA